ncbi:hypothetical protein [Serinibacter arcticus]|nr:hypothetical protein [Serinibacter arcticus]
MTDHDPLDEILASAARELRQSSDAGWVRAKDGIAARLLAALRPSQPVLATHGEGTFTVASTVLVAKVDLALAAVPRARVLRIGVETDDDQRLTGLALALSVQFPHPITEQAEAAREAALTAVHETTGIRLEPERISVDVMVADVHLALPEADPTD